MNDRTTCFGCENLKTFASETGNFYFWCKEVKAVVGKIKPKNSMAVYPKPPKTNKKCRYELVDFYKSKPLTKRPLIKWLFKKWGK
jgi:hypothetical protein